ncbi:MAG: phosphate ABC transporter ATP-binding protein [Acidobacteriota bacterium]
MTRPAPEVHPSHPRSDGETLTDIHIETHRLGLRYGKHVAFKKVSLAIYSGRITALIGPSGCGKTSFLSCLNRLTDLLPDCHVSGQATIRGLSLVGPGLDVVRLRRRVGMIFQKPNPFPMSIRRNIELPLREHGIRNKLRIDQILEASLGDVGLWDEVKDRLDAPAQQLSGGQQQRLCIARALALEPKVLLLDEPCSALDPLASGIVEDLILSLRGRLTQVVVTHNLAQARRIADDVAMFWRREGCGRLIEYGTARQIFEAPRETLTVSYVSGQRG